MYSLCIPAKLTISPLFIAFVVLLTVFNGTTASAQHHAVHEAATSRKVAQMQTTIMDRRMQLATTQKAQVSKINEAYAGKLTALLGNKQLTQAEKLQELQKLHTDKKADLKSILTVDQYNQYLKLQQDLKEQRSQRIRTGSSEVQEQ